MKTNEFLDLICGALNRKPGTLALADTNKTVEQWDSLGHLMLITVVSKLGVATDNRLAAKP
ncbi:MAG: hypothetical protein WCB27_18135 [Thermoguttaceae bacterium]